MARSRVSGISIILMLTGMLVFAFEIQHVRAGGTIYIRADGSIGGPSNATSYISTNNNVTYYFIQDILSDYDGIVVERSNIIIDGNWYNLQGPRVPGGPYKGFLLSGVNNVTIREIDIIGFNYGIVLNFSSYSIIQETYIFDNVRGIALHHSSNNSITGNRINANWGGGILLSHSSNNSITGNNIENHRNTPTPVGGIDLTHSSSNGISRNTIANNNYGVELWHSSKNVFYHNNLLNNDVPLGYAWNSSTNIWDDSYPSGGNCWSNYEGIDIHSGPYQNESGSDGIGDSPYEIYAFRNGYYVLYDNDSYPLMNPMGSPQPPIAIFTYTPENPEKGETVTFNASTSHDRDGYITNYFWKFGDGNETSVTTETITHVYAVPNNYTANLTVMDNDGLNQSTTKSVTITGDSIPPTTVHDYDGSWQTTDFTITLTATDDLSGAAETYYRVNSEPTKNVSTHGHPFITTEDANNTLEYWSVDNADNEEFPHKILTGIKLDKTVPSIDVPSREPAGDVQPDLAVKVSVNVTDTTSTVQNVALHYTINNGTIWEEPIPMNLSVFTGLYEATVPPQEADTSVRFRIVAYDYAGNNATLDGTEPYCVYHIIPEYPSFLILPLLMAVAFLIAIAHRRRHKTS